MPARYASLATRTNMERAVGELEECKKNPIAWNKIQDTAAFNKRLDTTKAQLATITPPDTTGAEKDKIVRRINQLREAYVHGNSVAPRVLSQAEMMKCPTGAPSQALQHEMYWKSHNLDADGKAIRVDPRQGQRSGLSEIKDLMRTLGKEAEADDPDVANLDLLRPADSNIPLMDHRLPRTYGLSSQAKERFDETFPDREPLPVEKKIAESKAEKPKTGKYQRKPIPEEVRCVDTKKNGDPCKARREPESKYCGFHVRAHKDEVAQEA